MAIKKLKNNFRVLNRIVIVTETQVYADSIEAAVIQAKGLTEAELITLSQGVDMCDSSISVVGVNTLADWGT